MIGVSQQSKARWSSFVGVGCLCIGFLGLIALAWNPMASSVAPAAVITGVAFGLAAFGLRDAVAQLGVRADHVDVAEKLRELEEANRLLELTETKARVGHWKLNLATDEIYWSPGTFAIHGLPVGTPPALDEAIDYFHPEDREIVESAIEQSRQTGEPYEFRARIIRDDGSIRHTQSTALVEFGDDGTPVSLFGVVCDRTEEETMQSDLRQARNKADAMAHAKSAFLAKMSHEIRTPLNGVIGFAELLTHSTLDPQQTRYVELLTDSGKSLQTLLNDILDMSKIEAGEFDINAAPVDLGHLVKRVVQLFEPLAREKAISLSSRISPRLPKAAMLDSLRLRQVLSNLINNAIRFTDEGGIQVDVDYSDGTLAFTVSDTGTGIAPDMLEAIFDPFSQDTSHGDKSSRGTGLGLSISRQLAELMGGKLSVSSTKGEGSTFTLHLPFQPAIAAPKRSSTACNEPASESSAEVNVRILLAEDYVINQELICEMGRRLGFEFELVENGAQAVQAVMEACDIGAPYSLVLMDLQMPEMGGLDASRAIRDAGLNADTLPIIALTANAFEDDVEACLAAGMQEHVAKPVELARLRDVLQRWINQNDRTMQTDLRGAA